MPVESTTQSLCDLALRFGEDTDEGGGMVSAEACFDLICMQGQPVAGCCQGRGLGRQGWVGADR